MQANIYLTFNGKAHEALQFYADLFDGKVTETRKFSELPEADQIEEAKLDWIAHSKLWFGGQVIMASDVMRERDYIKPRGFNIQLDWDNAADAERVFNALAENGEIYMTFGPTFWAEGFGVVRDRFDVPWMINCLKRS